MTESLFQIHVEGLYQCALLGRGLSGSQSWVVMRSHCISVSCLSVCLLFPSSKSQTPHFLFAEGLTSERKSKASQSRMGWVRLNQVVSCSRDHVGRCLASLPELLDFIHFGKTMLVVNKQFGLFGAIIKPNEAYNSHNWMRWVFSQKKRKPADSQRVSFPRNAESFRSLF